MIISQTNNQTQDIISCFVTFKTVINLDINTPINSLWKKIVLLI